MNQSGQILLIADDESASRHYRGALEAAGYAVTHTESFVDTLDATASEPDLIVLCQLAALAYPGQVVPVLRIRDQMTPDDLVMEVHRKIALRAALLSSAIQSAA